MNLINPAIRKSIRKLFHLAGIQLFLLVLIMTTNRTQAITTSDDLRGEKESPGKPLLLRPEFCALSLKRAVLPGFFIRYI
jgi:hypothetical protein